MDPRMMLLCVGLAMLCATLAVGAETQLFVVPDGSDQNPGTNEKPLATISKARDLARTARAKQPGPLTILLRSGTHYLPETLVFSAEDSGTKDAPLIIAAAPDRTPVISGGQKLKLVWKPGDGGVEVGCVAAEVNRVASPRWTSKYDQSNGPAGRKTG